MQNHNISSKFILGYNTWIVRFIKIKFKKWIKAVPVNFWVKNLPVIIGFLVIASCGAKHTTPKPIPNPEKTTAEASNALIVSEAEAKISQNSLGNNLPTNGITQANNNSTNEVSVTPAPGEKRGGLFSFFGSMLKSKGKKDPVIYKAEVGNYTEEQKKILKQDKGYYQKLDDENYFNPNLPFAAEKIQEYNGLKSLVLEVETAPPLVRFNQTPESAITKINTGKSKDVAPAFKELPKNVDGSTPKKTDETEKVINLAIDDNPEPSPANATAKVNSKKKTLIPRINANYLAKMSKYDESNVKHNLSNTAKQLIDSLTTTNNTSIIYIFYKNSTSLSGNASVNQQLKLHVYLNLIRSYLYGKNKDNFFIQEVKNKALPVNEVFLVVKPISKEQFALLPKQFNLYNAPKEKGEAWSLEVNKLEQQKLQKNQELYKKNT